MIRQHHTGGAPRVADTEEPEMAQTWMVLIIEPEWDPAQHSPEEFADMGTQHRAFAEAVHAAGAKILDGDALAPSKEAVRITPARKGSPAVFTDGPFPELKELVTGYYKIEAADEAQARQLAALCPTAGRIELFPIFDTSAM
jgi:hypothetical protein